jgi:hypothetical protein
MLIVFEELVSIGDHMALNDKYRSKSERNTLGDLLWNQERFKPVKKREEG